MTHQLTFITPLFSKGCYDDQPEIRPSSIRGQLHWWFRALGGTAAEENAIFGSVHNAPPLASKIVVRASRPDDGKGGVAQKAELNTLPHKRGGEASPKWAYKPGTTFELHLTERLGGLNESRRNALRRALEAWLLAGTLGLRSTRAGGSFVWKAESEGAVPMPSTMEEYSRRLSYIFEEAPLQVHLLKEPFSSAEAARLCVSDTLGGRQDPKGNSDLSRLRDPLGKIFGGRKTSPLRFRVVRLGEAFYIVATWDDRSAVTGNQAGDFAAVVDLLAQRKKPIGLLLKTCL